MSLVRPALSFGLFIFWFGGGTMLLLPASEPFSWWIRASLAAVLFGKSAVPFFQLITSVRGQPTVQAIARGYRAMAIAYVVAGCIVTLAGLSQRNFFGFLVAYAGFSWAWVWFFVGKKFWTEQLHTDNRKSGAAQVR